MNRGQFKPRTIVGTPSQISVVNGDGISGDPTISIPVAAAIGAPSLVASYNTAEYGPELAPAIATWTGSGGAAWSSPSWSIPTGGSISTNIDVVSGAMYQIEISRTFLTLGNVYVSLGDATLVEYGGNDFNPKITLTATITGTVALTIGDSDGAWSATIENVSVKRVLTFPSPAYRICNAGNWYVRSNGTGSLASGNGHGKRTSGDHNLAVGYEAQLNLTTGNGNHAFGRRSQYSVTSGMYNNAYGYFTQRCLTTGVYNNAFGYSAQESITIGSWNEAMGNEAQRDITSGNDNVAIGRRAQNSITTGNGNVGIGSQVQYCVGVSTANRLITASHQVCIGYQSGQSSPTQADYLTTIGALSKGTINATAIGAKASAGGVGSIAIGCDSAGTGASTTAQDEIALGTALHTTKIAGKLNMVGIATTDPQVAGQVWSNNGVLTVSAGV